ncbi:hypothetical protein GCM10009641_86410 [Mycobacterium cookii]
MRGGARIGGSPTSAAPHECLCTQRVANISTSATTDAKPAAAASDIDARACQGMTFMYQPIVVKAGGAGGSTPADRGIRQ